MDHQTTMNDEHVLVLSKEEYERLLEELDAPGEVLPNLLELLRKVKEQQFQAGVASTYDYDLDSWDGSWDGYDESWSG